jgi:hypothetical protein
VMKTYFKKNKPIAPAKPKPATPKKISQ